MGPRIDGRCRPSHVSVSPKLEQSRRYKSVESGNTQKHVELHLSRYRQKDRAHAAFVLEFPTAPQCGSERRRETVRAPIVL